MITGAPLPTPLHIHTLSTYAHAYTQNCNESVVNFFNENLGYIAGVGTAFGVFEVSTFAQEQGYSPHCM